MKKIVVLGDGQIWDLRGVDPKYPQGIFEELFSGRALEKMANSAPEIFSQYIEGAKTKITGMSVTKALLDKKNKRAKVAALKILEEMAKNAARGIEVLTKAKGCKPGWKRKEINLWKGLSGVVIGGGVSRGKTGTIIIKGIKDYLRQRGLDTVEIFKARFPGKESGFLGSIVNILDFICSEARKRKLSKIAAIGIDLGREKIGVGILLVNLKSHGIINFPKSIWVLYRYSVRTIQSKNRIKNFKQHRKLGEELRSRIISQIARLIICAENYAQKTGIVCSKHIGLASPGETSTDGYLIGSTDYLPLFTKKDGFHFSKAVEENLAGKGFPDFHIRIINDGIAACLANLRLGLDFKYLKNGKYAFLGPGSGLGGCLCRVKEV